MRPLLNVGWPPDGAACRLGRVSGGYVHGLFDHAAARRLAELSVAWNGRDQSTDIEAEIDVGVDGFISCAAVLLAVRITPACWPPCSLCSISACASAKGPAGCLRRRSCARRSGMACEVASLDDVLAGRL